MRGVIALSLLLSMLLIPQKGLTMIHYQEEWSQLVPLARINGLTETQIVLLLAIREVEAGSVEAGEFGVKAAKGQGLKEQALWTIGSIKKNEQRYQDYVRDIEHFNVGKVIDFIEFFAYKGGPYSNGWCPIEDRECSFWVKNVKSKIKEVKYEFSKGVRVGRED